MSTNHANYRDLERDVNNVLKMDTVSENTEKTGFNIMNYCKAPYIFVLVPIVFGAILFFMKPSIVMDVDPENKEEKTLSIKKIAIYTSVLSIIVIGCYYYFYGKMKPKPNTE